MTLEHFKRVAPADLSISSITIMEIEYALKLNAAREEKIRAFWQAFLDEIHVVPFDNDEAICTGLLRVHLKNQIIGAYDCMIAGTDLVICFVSLLQICMSFLD